MKIFIVIAFLLVGFGAMGQTNYSKTYGGYHFNDRLAASGTFHIPAGTTPALGTGGWGRAGALYLDTVGGNKGLHGYWDGAWHRMVDTAWTGLSSFVTTRDRFGLSGEDTRATGARYFSAANQVFTIDSMGTGSRIVQRSKALVANAMSFVNHDATDSAYITVSGVNGGAKFVQVGVSNTTIASNTNYGAYHKIVSGGVASHAMTQTLYVATQFGNISDFYQDSVTTYIRSYDNNSNAWSNISLYHDSSTWWQGLQRTSVINLYDKAADQFAQDRLAWRTTDSTGKIIIEKNVVELYAGQNEITLENPTGITIEPYKQNLYIDSLAHTLTATAKMVTWDSATGRIETRAIPAAGSGTVTSVSAGYGMNFTTITGTGSVIADTGVLVNKNTTQVISATKNFTTLQRFSGDMGSTPDDTKGIELSNPTTATAGNVKVSPEILQKGQAWKTAATAAARNIFFRNYVLPIENLNGYGRWVVESNYNSGGWNERFGVGKDGDLYVSGNEGTDGAFLMSGGTGSPASWNSTKFARNLTTSTTQVGNVGSGEDDLITYSIPANTLSTDGDKLTFTCLVTVAVNSTLKAYYGGTTLFTLSALATENVYRLTGEIIRTGSATQITSFTISGGLGTTQVGYQLPTETLSGAVTFKLTGTGTNNDDIVQRMLTIDYVPKN